MIVIAIGWRYILIYEFLDGTGWQIMGFDVTAFFDCEAERIISELWRVIQETIPESRQTQLGTRPHMTLGIYKYDLPANAPSLIAKVAQTTQPVSITFDCIQSYTSQDFGSLLLRPQLTSDLARFHRCSFDVFKQAGFIPIQRHWPESWWPHCTLANGLPTELMKRAQTILNACGLPVLAKLTGIACVTFSPLQEHYFTKLRWIWSDHAWESALCVFLIVVLTTLAWRSISRKNINKIVLKLCIDLLLVGGKNQKGRNRTQVRCDRRFRLAPES